MSWGGFLPVGRMIETVLGSMAAPASAPVRELETGAQRDGGAAPPREKWLARKARLNALAKVLDSGARLMVGLLINPLLVAGLGAYAYGALQLVVRASGYLSAVTGRPSQALTWTVSHHQGSTDDRTKRMHVGCSVLVWAACAPWLVLSGGALAWITPALLSAPNELHLSLRCACGLLVANLILKSLVDIPQSALVGQNLGYKRMGLSTVLVVLGGGLTAMALYFRTGMVGIAATYLANTLLSGALFAWIARQHVPWFGIARPSLALLRWFFSLSWWFLAWRLVNQLLKTGDVIVLGLLGSVELVTAFVLTRYSSEALINSAAILVGSAMPGLGGIIGSGDLSRAARIRQEILAANWLLATVVGTVIAVWNRSFVRLWVGDEFYAGDAATMLIVLAVMQFILFRCDAQIIDLTLELRGKVILGAFAAVVSLSTAAVLVQACDLGIVGVCLGVFVGRLMLSVGYPVLVGGRLGISTVAQGRAVLRPALVTALLLSAAFGSGGAVAHTWPGLATGVAVTALPVAALAMVAGLSRPVRSKLLSRCGFPARAHYTIPDHG
jgi:O-antigen/teichoic acid export membrane protein